MGSIPGWERSPGRGHSNPLQYSCLESPTNRGAWQATVHRVVKSQPQLKQLSTPLKKTWCMHVTPKEELLQGVCVAYVNDVKV